MFNLVRFVLCYAVFMLFFLSAENVTAEVDKALQAEGWEELVFDRKQANHFIARDDGVIEVVSESSVSLLKMPLAVDIETQQTLRWRWCVIDAAPATELAIKGADDRSLAIYVAFPFIAEEATAFERIDRKIVEATVGKDAPGRVLMYVWGGDEDRGTIVDSPYFGDFGMMKILRATDTPSGQWFTENVDIAEDYRRSFGKPPPDPLYIAISADTDDTKSTANGAVMGLEFIASPRLY